MSSGNTLPLRLPSVDSLMQQSAMLDLTALYGRSEVLRGVREVLAELRRAALAGRAGADGDVGALVREHLAQRLRLQLQRVFNLTGTVLHTNLGRALLPDDAVEHVAMAMCQPCNLEFDLDSGDRGDRDQLVEALLCELTGAEAATIVNNNAAAVLLTIAALAARRKVVVSRGELVEIGGAFRMPDVMAAAGATLKEIGTTNRTHGRDYADAIDSDTALLMKVHTSNYAITGFTTSVGEDTVARIAHDAGLPMAIDLGSGSLVDLSRYGLPKESVVRDMLAAGADIVTFSGDKLLGGPQSGLIVGTKAHVQKIKKHPLKRALRVSKITLAALEATLQLYRDPDRLASRLPTLRLLTRTREEIAALAERLRPTLAKALGDAWQVTTQDASSQIGSGSLPVDRLPSVALALAPAAPAKRGSGTALNQLAARFRRLPIPVIGRIADGCLLFDLRCLEDEALFVEQLSHL
ncbi:MAG TPA: L-seryl-tRNA(Sec) selenium transferase [Burkholderiales bacterium]|nr:L-seryl-tRNA(Sec) selenium transferase [Burkholderiales bacterium]